MTTDDHRWTDDIDSRLSAVLDADASGWLGDARVAVAESPATIRARFPAVSRKVGRGPLDPATDPDDPFVATVDDGARALLIASLPAADRPVELPELYRHGDTREKRGALRSLDLLAAEPGGLDGPMRPVARDLVDDAMRTNDTRLVAAALGTAGVAVLDDEALAQAVLKCVFVGVDIDRIPGLHDRITPELSRMMADFVHERIAAGRDVPAQVWPVIDAHPPTDRLAAIEAELDQDEARRADAARRALALRG